MEGAASCRWQTETSTVQRETVTGRGSIPSVAVTARRSIGGLIEPRRRLRILLLVHCTQDSRGTTKLFKGSIQY